MFCTKCGSQFIEETNFCNKCGQPRKMTVAANGRKSKKLALALAIMFGGMAYHNYYLGYSKKANIQAIIFLTFFIVPYVGPVISTIWAWGDAFLIIIGKINTDANGHSLI